MRSRSHRTIVRALVLVLVAGLTSPSVSFGLERSFPLNLKRVPIGKLIERVGNETGRTILFDEQVRGNISIVAKRPVTESEAWSILDSALSMLGFSLLPSTVSNWRISKVADAFGEAPFVTDIETATDPFVTALIPLAVADLQAVLNVLQPLAGTRVTLVPFEPTHSLIASGPEREIARLTTIADELDRVDEYKLRLRVLRHRDVEEVEPLIEARFQSGSISKRELQVWSDQRTNSILFRGSEIETDRLSRLLDRIDRPIEGEGQLRVLRVLNRDPEEIGELLRQLSQPGGAANAASGIPTPGSELAGAEFEIVVDRASRSLVVKADVATQIAVRKVLEILDEPPQQIAVDLTLSELRTPSSYVLGFGFSLPFSDGNNTDDLQGIVVSSPTPGILFAGPTEQTTVFGRLARDNGVPFTIDGGNGVEIPILQSGVLNGGEFNVHAEVLMEPSLIVTAGEHHEIFVGTNFPVPVSEESGLADLASGGAVGLLSVTTRFERTDIGIRLGIEAKAGRKGKIQLDLDVELSALAPSAAGNIAVVGPTFVNQALTATARLDDGETAIVAVHRHQKELDLRSGVPWLSDIPILGRFFSTEADSSEDVRLVIAVRARRLSTPAELVADSIRRRLAFQRRSARGAALPDSDGAPFGVRVTTRQREDDAKAIVDSLALRGYQTVLHSWSFAGEDYYDVYIVSLESMADAAEIAGMLSLDGWQADLVVLPTRS